MSLYASGMVQFLVLSSLLIVSQSSSTKIIEVYSISTTASFLPRDPSTRSISGPFAQSIVPGHIIAFNHINNRSDILSNYTITLVETEDCGQDPLEALARADDVVQQSADSQCDSTNIRNNIQSPVVLCCPWSAFSVVTSVIFQKHGYCQMSSSSSAKSLSSVSSFYRTIPNADVAAKAYIPLAKHFNWTKIGIVYIDDEYGINLKDLIHGEAKKENIEVQSKSFSYSSNITELSESLRETADFIKEFKLFITIIVASSSDISYIMSQFKLHNILQYPYYYLFRIIPNFEDQNLANLTQGYTTVIPFFPSLLTKQQYIDFNVYNGNETIYDISNEIYSKLVRSWKDIYDTNSSILYGVSEPHSYTVWGYDSAIALSFALDHLIKSGITQFDGNKTYRAYMMKMIKNYLTTSLSFIGATGLVEMDENGDRLYGYYMYGFINADSQFVPFGVYKEKDTINITHSITFPLYFEGKSSEIPLSETRKITETVVVNSDWYGCVIGFCIILILFTVCLAIIILKESKHEIIRKSSWKLNLILCFGSILGFILLTLQRTNDFGCLITSYAFGITFTLIFMPIFAKLYRLYHIINTAKIDRIMSAQFETKLIVGIFIMVVIDILLFIAITSTHFINGNVKSLVFVKSTEIEVDALLIKQNQYEICQTDRVEVAVAFTVIIAVYKIIQFGFGLYFSFWSFRWKYNVPHNDEISYALLSIIFSLVLSVAMIIFLLFNSNQEEVTKTYCMFSFLMMSIITIMIIGNIVPRIYYRFKKYKRYNLSPEEIMMNYDKQESSQSDIEDELTIESYDHVLDTTKHPINTKTSDNEEL